MRSTLTLHGDPAIPICIRPMYDNPRNTPIELMYPSALDSVTLIHYPSNMSAVRIHCDTENNTWIIMQQKFVDNNNTGEWAEVARISGNGPGWIDT